MRLFWKVLLRMMVGSMILALPRVALASPHHDSDDGSGGLNGIVDRLGEGVLDQLFFGSYLSGCWDANDLGD